MRLTFRPSEQANQTMAKAAGVQAVITHPSSCPTEAWDDPLRGQVRWWTLLSGDRTPSARMTCGVAEIAPGRPDQLSPHRHAEP